MSNRDEHELWRWWEEQAAPDADDLFERGPGFFTGFAMTMVTMTVFYLGIFLLVA